MPIILKKRSVPQVAREPAFDPIAHARLIEDNKRLNDWCAANAGKEPAACAYCGKAYLEPCNAQQSTICNNRLFKLGLLPADGSLPMPGDIVAPLP